jgi:hypothetical protein
VKLREPTAVTRRGFPFLPCGIGHLSGSAICLIDPYQRHNGGLIPNAGATRELLGEWLMPDLYGLTLQVQAGPADDEDELLKLTSRLRDELLDLEVAGVDPVTEESAPEQAKGLATLAGWLVVQFGSISGLRTVVGLIRDWAARTNRQVEITVDGEVLKASGISAAQQEKLIDVWLSRHGPVAPTS